MVFHSHLINVISRNINDESTVIDKSTNSLREVKISSILYFTK